MALRVKQDHIILLNFGLQFKILIELMNWRLFSLYKVDDELYFVTEVVLVDGVEIWVWVFEGLELLLEKLLVVVDAFADGDLGDGGLFGGMMVETFDGVDTFFL
jgi:hypothetical protein